MTKTVRLLLIAALMLCCTAAALADTYHTVKRGETLQGIANRNRVTLSALLSANGLKKTSAIRVGQRLRIPGKAGATAAPAPTAAKPAPTPAPAAPAVDTVQERINQAIRQQAAQNQQAMAQPQTTQVFQAPPELAPKPRKMNFRTKLVIFALLQTLVAIVAAAATTLLMFKWMNK
jgi:LysM repeat protein